MINSVVLIGRITRDPEVRFTQNGLAVCSFSIAVDRKYKSPNGERETDFINCVAWRKAAELIGKYTQKGSLLGVQGTLQVRKYTDKDGNNRVATDVVVEDFQFLDSKGSGGSQAGTGQPPQRSAPQAPPQHGPGPSAYGDPPPDNLMDDDLPF